MFAAQILEKPRIVDGQIQKGALILSDGDEIGGLIPALKSFFYLIERRGWAGMNSSKLADIKLVEDLSTWEQTKIEFPNCILLDIAAADFVDTDNFKPLLLSRKVYTAIQIARWEKFKRPELLVTAAALLPRNSFVMTGHFSTDHDPAGIIYRKEIMAMASQSAAKISFPYSKITNNKKMPLNPKTINRMINTSKMGILTTTVEGINRFKMECLAANIPVLIPSDCSSPTKKHINNQTGVVFEPTPRALAEAIGYVETNYDTFSPREYVLKNTGIKKSVEKLKTALQTVSKNEKTAQSFTDIFWDGRNESLRWGDKALEEIKKCISRVAGNEAPRAFWKMW